MENRFKRVLIFGIVATIFGVIAFMLFRNIGEIRDAIRNETLKLNLSWLLAAVFLILLYLLARTAMWQLITARNDAAVPFRKAAAIWLVSYLGKNLPGKVMLVLGKVYFYRSHGVGAGRISFCFVVETLMDLLGATVVFLICVPMVDLPTIRNPAWIWSFAAAGAALVFCVLSPPVLKRCVGWTARFRGKTEVEIRVKYLDILQFAAMSVLNWTILGLGFFALVRSMVFVDFDQLAYFTGAFAVATIVGIVSLFAPSGLGVREGILLALLQYKLPVGIAAIVVIGSRIWFTLGELAGAAIALWILDPGILRKIKQIKTDPDKLRVD
jgi:uncharacterized membrane protein YbhN (UPF0104 family)